MDAQQLAGLPPEFQAQIQKLLRQQQIAQQLAQGAMGTQTQVVSGHAVRTSPLEGVARALTAFGGMKQAGDLQDQMLAAQQQGVQARQDEGRGLIDLYGQNPRAAIAKALVSPSWSKLGETWQKTLDERVNKAAEVQKETDPSGALKTLSNGQMPQGWTPPPVPDPTFGTDPSNNPYALTVNRKGEKEVKYAPKGVSVNIPGKEGEMALDTLKTQLKTREERALAARDALRSNMVSLDAINEGAKMGGGEGVKQAIRKVAQAFNLNAPETTPTEVLAMNLGDAILANARKLAPVTGEDLRQLQGILGSINTDPSALQRALIKYNALAMKELQDYNNWVGEQSKNLKTDYARDMFQGAGIGFEQMPPPGNTYQQMLTLQELQKRGGNVGNFAIGGEPMDPNSTFNLKPPTAPQPAPVNASPLTPQEQAELEQLRKRFGGGAR